jgi:ComEC/Rec2-related protein
MKQFLKLNIITISIHPITWGCAAFITTIGLLSSTDQNYILIALVACLFFPLFLSLKTISLKVKVIVIASVLLAITSYNIRLYYFNSYYNSEQSSLDRYALVEDATSTQVGGNYPFLIKIIAYDVDSANRYMLNFATKKSLIIPIGQCIIIPSGKKRLPKSNNFRNYLLKTEIDEAIFLISAPGMVDFESKSFLLGIKHYFLHQKQLLLQYIHTTFSPQTAYFFALIFLSKVPDYHQETQLIRQSFANWGILHIIARSGLHLMVLFILFGYIFCGVPIIFRTSIIMIPIYFYTCISWFSISFGRALLSLSLSSYATIKKYAIKPWDVLMLTTYMFILYNPFVIFALDFQLSFGITAILCFISEIEQSKTLATHK